MKRNNQRYSFSDSEANVRLKISSQKKYQNPELLAPTSQKISFLSLYLSKETQLLIFSKLFELFIILIGIPLFILRLCERFGLFALSLLDKTMRRLSVALHFYRQNIEKTKRLKGKRMELLLRLKQNQLRKEKISKENHQKIDLVLDIDETLIFCDNKLNHPKMEIFKINDKEFKFLKRPGLEDFLEKVNKNFNVHVYTAGEKEYADNILKKIDGNNIIKKKLYRMDCDLNKGCLTKNLLKINEDLQKIIIVDNSAEAVKDFQDNSLIIKTWEGDDKDSELDFFRKLLFELSIEDDVRRKIRKIKREIDFNS